MPFEINTAPDGVIITGSGAAANAVPIGPFDTTKFMNFVVQISGTFTAANVAFEGSNDEINPTNWFGILSSNTATGAMQTTTGVSSVGSIWYVPGVCKWFRVRVVSIATGSVAVNCLFSEDQLPSIQNSNQVVTGTVSLATKTSGGATQAKVKTTASTNGTVVKASAGVIFGWHLSNTSASAKFLKLYQKATAPVPGTDVPVSTYLLPANSTIHFESEIGFNMPTGIGYGITGAVSETDATATAVDDVVGHILYA